FIIALEEGDAHFPARAPSKGGYPVFEDSPVLALYDDAAQQVDVAGAVGFLVLPCEHLAGYDVDELGGGALGRERDEGERMLVACGRHLLRRTGEHPPELHEHPRRAVAFQRRDDVLHASHVLGYRRSVGYDERVLLDPRHGVLVLEYGYPLD